MIIRTQITKKFTTVPNEIFELKDLRAVGLISYLLSRPDNWEVQVKEIRARFRLGRDTLRKLFKALEVAGFAKLVRVPAQGGKKAGSTWIITNEPFNFPKIETPEAEPQNREPENQGPGDENRPPEKPTVGKSGPLINTDPTNTCIINTECEEGTQKKDEIDFEEEAIGHICKSINSASRAVKDGWEMKHGGRLRQSGKTAAELVRECAEHLRATDPVFSVREGEELLYYVKLRAAKVYQIFFQNKWLPNVRPAKNNVSPAAFSSFNPRKYAQGA